MFPHYVCRCYSAESLPTALIEFHFLCALLSEVIGLQERCPSRQRGKTNPLRIRSSFDHVRGNADSVCRDIYASVLNRNPCSQCCDCGITSCYTRLWRSVNNSKQTPFYGRIALPLLRQHLIPFVGLTREP